VSVAHTTTDDSAEVQVMAHLVLVETCETRSLAALMISPGWVAENALATRECLTMTRLDETWGGCVTAGTDARWKGCDWKRRVRERKR
jgi:hypothetical protein